MEGLVVAWLNCLPEVRGTRVVLGIAWYQRLDPAMFGYCRGSPQVLFQEGSSYDTMELMLIATQTCGVVCGPNSTTPEGPIRVPLWN